jgi:plastocyanin
MTIARSRRGWWALGVALAVLAFGLALVGIRGASASDATAHVSGARTVTIEDFAFHPPTITVGAGSRVVFSNTSKVTHTATRKGSFASGRIKPGKSVAITFGQKGTFAYHCTIHPFMHGKVIVD